MCCCLLSLVNTKVLLCWGTRAYCRVRSLVFVFYHYCGALARHALSPLMQLHPNPFTSWCATLRLILGVDVVGWLPMGVVGDGIVDCCAKCRLGLLRLSDSGAVAPLTMFMRFKLCLAGWWGLGMGLGGVAGLACEK